MNNELYIGKLIWNRQRFVKDPASGKRQARLNPRDEWVTQDVPELRIIGDDLWSAVKDKQRKLQFDETATAPSTAKQLVDRRRPRYLLSGLTRCGRCGGGFSMISAAALGCSTARNKGTCENRTTIRRDQLETRVLGALRHHLMEPALFAEFCEEFTREMNRVRSAGRQSVEAARAEVKKIDRDLDMLVDMILRGGAADRLNAKMLVLEERKRELESSLAHANEPPPLLHPEMAGYYRRQVNSLHELLRDGSPAERLRATDILRSLIFAIVLTPNEEGLEMDVQGDLAGILTVASNAKGPAAFAAGPFASMLIAGTRFHLSLRSPSPARLASFCDLMPSPALFPGLFAALA